MARRESVFDMVSGMVAKDLEPLKRHLTKKARREWAEREAEKLCRKHKYFSEPAVALAFLQEHTRAVRIAKADLAELKRDQHSYSVATKNELVKRLERLLVKLQKGRA